MHQNKTLKVLQTCHYIQKNHLFLSRNMYFQPKLTISTKCTRILIPHTCLYVASTKMKLTACSYKKLETVQKYFQQITRWPGKKKEAHITPIIN